MARYAVRVFINVFGFLAVVVVLVSLVIYLTVESLLTASAIGLLTGMICLLIYIAVSFERLSSFLSRQSTKYGLNLLVSAVVLLVIIGIIEVIAARHNKRFDLTDEQVLTLSPLTKKVLQALEQEVTVTVFYQRDQIFEFRDLLKQYGDETEKLSYQFFNLDQNPGRAKEFRIGSYGGTAVESGGKRRTYPYCTEENVTNGIITVTREKEEVVYFVTGHGERDFKSQDKRDGYSNVDAALEMEGYTVKTLLLLREKRVPEDASVVIVAGPQEDFLPPELSAISEYLERGGRVLLLLDPYTVPALLNYLKDYNILVGNDMVVDKESKLVVGDIFSPVVPFYRKHPITSNFDIATVFPLVCSVEALDPPQSDKVDAQPLARTSPDSWAETNRESIKEGTVYFQEWEDKKGPVSVAVVAEIKGTVANTGTEKAAGEGNGQPSAPGGRMVVLGDSDFVSNLYFAVLGNQDFFLNMVNWLAEAEELISIRHKKKEAYPFSPLFLTENQKKIVFWFAVVIQPLFILCIGIFIYARRKARG
jgi:ABC-type uncharacterized transport system involved in gliding motility auxiliary subunit